MKRNRNRKVNGSRFAGAEVSTLRSYLLAGWAMASCLVLAVFLVYGIYAILQVTEELAKGNQMVASHYALQLNKDIDSMKGYVNRVYSENAQYQTLKRPYLQETEWYSAAYYLANDMEGRAGSIDYFGGVFFYDAWKDTLRSRYSEFPHAGDIYRLNLCLKSYLMEIGDTVCHEGFFEYEGEGYLVYVRGVRQKLLGFVLNLTNYFAHQDGLELVFCDSERVLETIGPILSGSRGAELAESVRKGQILQGSGIVVATEPINFRQMRLAVIQETGGMRALVGSWEFWLLFILIPLILVGVLFRIRHLFSHTLVWPVEHLASRLDRMKEDKKAGEYPETEGTKVRELLEINHRLDEIVEEMQHMQQEKYKKEMEANAAKLQYYQLQVNPHFFINCLNIMDSLLADGDVDTVRRMIRWLSEHFRYVFQSQESLVTIGEELKEVEAYCHIYMVRGEMPILILQEVERELLDCRVPILAIQTFVENAVKHANRPGQILSVEVAVKELEREDGLYISIRISDNGKGYPEERLEELNAPVTEFRYHSRHVGIDNVKYRIYLMYGERAQLFFYNGPSKGAVAELLLPKREERSG